MTKGRRDMVRVIERGVLAGAAGGLAEIMWVSIYSTVSGGDAASVAAGVTTASGLTALFPSAPFATGIAIHMMLAVLLGIALACLWQGAAGRFSVRSRFAGVVALLAAIWAINFFVILPAMSPDFIHMVPYAVSLVSKLLFGLAAAETLRRSAHAAEGFTVPASGRL
jgi:hypothetical protein